MQHRMLGGGYTNMDSEYDQGYGMEPGSMMMANMPDQVANFLRDFQDWIHRDVYVQNNQGGYEPDAQLRQEKLNEIQTCYEYKFSKFSEVFYNNQAWPHADLVSQLVDGDDVFLMLYKELYFRHLHAKLGLNITIEQRIESWENYTSLFDRIFSDEDDDNNFDRLDLPMQWLWDMVDEFVYQFTDFCRFRSTDLKKRSASEIEIMAQRPNVWDSMQVMSTLHRMVAVALHFAERRNNFVASVSHELKTPLTAIRMYSEMLRDGIVRDDAELTGFEQHAFGRTLFQQDAPQRPPKESLRATRGLPDEQTRGNGQEGEEREREETKA